jgi:transposase-like protein
LDNVSEAAAKNEAHELTCPHCKRGFSGELLAGNAPRYSGFKCPHCRLFVPLERVEETEQPSA